jgi:hypothetical protein
MSQSRLSQEELAQLVEDEFARLERPGNLDLRVELQHHVWPVLQEIVAMLNERTDDGAVLPAEVVARVAALLVHLIQIATKSVSIEEQRYLLAAANETINELLEYVDPGEWADLTGDLAVVEQPAPAPEPMPASVVAPEPVAPQPEATSDQVGLAIPTTEVAS